MQFVGLNLTLSKNPRIRADAWYWKVFFQAAGRLLEVRNFLRPRCLMDSNPVVNDPKFRRPEEEKIELENQHPIVDSSGSSVIKWPQTHPGLPRDDIPARMS